MGDEAEEEEEEAAVVVVAEELQNGKIGVTVMTSSNQRADV